MTTNDSLDKGLPNFKKPVARKFLAFFIYIPQPAHPCWQSMYKRYNVGFDQANKWRQLFKNKNNDDYRHIPFCFLYSLSVCNSPNSCSIWLLLSCNSLSLLRSCLLSGLELVSESPVSSARDSTSSVGSADICAAVMVDCICLSVCVKGNIIHVWWSRDTVEC